MYFGYCWVDQQQYCVRVYTCKFTCMYKQNCDLLCHLHTVKYFPLNCNGGKSMKLQYKYVRIVLKYYDLKMLIISQLSWYFIIK